MHASKDSMWRGMWKILQIFLGSKQGHILLLRPVKIKRVPSWLRTENDCDNYSNRSTLLCIVYTRRIRYSDLFSKSKYIYKYSVANCHGRPAFLRLSLSVLLALNSWRIQMCKHVENWKSKILLLVKDTMDIYIWSKMLGVYYWRREMLTEEVQLSSAKLWQVIKGDLKQMFKVFQRESTIV
jgi:hypothetical protein